MKQKSIKSQAIKTKKMLKVCHDGYAILLPKKWINEMDWVRDSIIKCVYNPDERRIYLEKTSDTDTEADRICIQDSPVD